MTSSTPPASTGLGKRSRRGGAPSLVDSRVIAAVTAVLTAFVAADQLLRLL